MKKYTEEDMDSLFKEGLKKLSVDYSAHKWDTLDARLMKHNAVVNKQKLYKKIILFTSLILAIFGLGYWIALDRNKSNVINEINITVIDSVTNSLVLDSIKHNQIDSDLFQVKSNLQTIKSIGKATKNTTQPSDTIIKIQNDSLKKDGNKFIFW